MNATLYLKRGAVRPLLRGHPWVYAQNVQRVQGSPGPGDVVRLVDNEGVFLSWAWYSPKSHIRARSLVREEGRFPDEAWLEEALESSLARRQSLMDEGVQGFRVVNAEADGLPGLVVDRYGDGLVIQALSAGAESVKQKAAAWLERSLKPAWIWERSDQPTRELEGLPLHTGPLAGEEPGRVRVDEPGLSFWVEPAGGQKTGFYLDQRDNRRLAASLAQGRRVLDCFSYSGGFALRCLLAGAASATLVDSSADALDLAQENLRLNGLVQGAELVRDKARRFMKRAGAEGRAYDLIILDPPKLAPTRAAVEKAARAYKDLNLLAMRLLAPGGILATFSCSAGMDRPAFLEMLVWAAQDAGRDLQITHHLGQPPDHPVRLGFPESEYLKGVVMRAV